MKLNPALEIIRFWSIIEVIMLVYKCWYVFNLDRRDVRAVLVVMSAPEAQLDFESASS